MGKLGTNLKNYFLNPEKFIDGRNKFKKADSYEYLIPYELDQTILDFNFVQTRKLKNLYIKAPELIKIDEKTIKRIKEKINLNKFITSKELDNILLKSMYSCSLSFHKNVNNDLILRKNDLNNIQDIVCNICLKDDQFPKEGKCTKNTFIKIKTIINDNLFNFLINDTDIRKIGFLFHKSEIKQTKLLIKNFFNNQNLSVFKNFPNLIIQSTKFENCSKNELFFLLYLISENLNKCKSLEEKYIKDYHNCIKYVNSINPDFKNNPYFSNMHYPFDHIELEKFFK